MSCFRSLPRIASVGAAIVALALTLSIPMEASSATAKGRHAAPAIGERISLGGAKHKRAKTGTGAPSARVAKLVSTTSSTPTSATDLLFQASRLSDFWLRQSAPGAITEVADPAGSGESVFKLTVNDSDVYPVTPTENPRAEMLSPSKIKSGDEFWWSTKFFLPADFPSKVPGWMNLMQGPYGSPFNGSPPFHIEVNGTNIQWARNQTYGWDVPWKMPLVRNSWVEVMIHERFAYDGWLELWINGQQVTFFAGDTYNPNRVAPTTRLAMQTMDSSNNGATNSVYVQSYRKKGMFPSVTTYAGPLKVGTSRAAVE